MFGAIVLSVLVAFVHCEYEEDEKVLVLKTDNFEAAIEEFKFLLVEFCKYYITGFCIELSISLSYSVVCSKCTCLFSTTANYCCRMFIVHSILYHVCITSGFSSRPTCQSRMQIQCLQV